MDIKAIKELADRLKEYNLTEITLESNGEKITLKKEIVAPVVSSPVVQATPSLNKEKAIKTEEIKDGNEIVSPMIGTFYSAPSPDTEPFVKVGDRVNIGDTLCIVEAMKMMNEIKATCSGEIVEIKVKNGNIVKKDECLFVIK